MVYNFDSHHLNWEKRVQWWLLIHSLFFRLIHQFLHYFQVFLLLVFSFIELLQAAVKNFTLKFRDWVNQSLIKPVEQEANELQGLLRHCNIFILKDDRHELRHSSEQIRVDLYRQMFLLLFSVWMGWDIIESDFLFNVGLLFVDQKEGFFKDWHLPEAQSG